MAAEDIPTSPDALRNPQVLSQEELAAQNAGTLLSIIFSEFGDARQRHSGLHEVRFVKLPPYAHDAWKDMGQGWFQSIPDYGHRPVHINGTRRTHGELVTGETVDFVIYDTVDPDNQSEVDRVIREGGMIPSKMPAPGTIEYESVLRSRTLVATDPTGKIHWRIMQQRLGGRVVSMQLEQPEAADSQPLL